LCRQNRERGLARVACLKKGRGLSMVKNGEISKTKDRGSLISRDANKFEACMPSSASETGGVLLLDRSILRRKGKNINPYVPQFLNGRGSARKNNSQKGRPSREELSSSTIRPEGGVEKGCVEAISGKKQVKGRKLREIRTEPEENPVHNKRKRRQRDAAPRKGMPTERPPQSGKLIRSHG